MPLSPSVPASEPLQTSTFDIEAFAGGGQADATELTTNFNFITIVATAGDSVKLPETFAVNESVYIKNVCASPLDVDVFPAVGDDLGLGVDVAFNLRAGQSVRYFATVADSEWQKISTTTAESSDPILTGAILNPTRDQASGVPTLVPNKADLPTGIGSGGVGILRSIVGGIIGMIGTDLGSHVAWDLDTHVITASPVQTQGQAPLQASVNFVATVNNPNDVVTAPAAADGRLLEIYNTGLNILQVFPASGDDLGAGTDTSLTIAVGVHRSWRGLQDGATWFETT